MSLVTRAGDLVYTFRFLKLLVTPFNETEAFKLGIIDADGKRIKSKKIETGNEKGAFTPFHRLVFNIKKLLAKAPGGSSRLASYAAALFLLKEKYSMSDKNMQKIIDKCGVDSLDLIEESTGAWYLLDDRMLSPGVYRVRNEKLLSTSMYEMVNPKDKIRALDQCYPVGNILGIDVYEGIHVNTNQPIYFTLGEIYK
jgi:hypothetical protein